MAGLVGDRQPKRMGNYLAVFVKQNNDKYVNALRYEPLKVQVGRKVHAITVYGLKPPVCPLITHSLITR